MTYEEYVAEIKKGEEYRKILRDRERFCKCLGIIFGFAIGLLF